MKRLIVALLVGGAVFGTVLAVAASLNVDGGVIQVGVDDTLTCDEGGVTVDSFAVNDIPGDYEGVEFVRIKDVSPACAGARMYLRVDSDSGVLAYSSGVPTYGSAPCYSVNNWVIAQTVEPPGGYMFYMVDGGRTNHLFVDPEQITSIKMWIEGHESAGTECIP